MMSAATENHSPKQLKRNARVGGLEARSLNPQAQVAKGACPVLGASLSFRLGIWLETQAGAGQPRDFWPFIAGS